MGTEREQNGNVTGTVGPTNVNFPRSFVSELMFDVFYCVSERQAESSIGAVESADRGELRLTYD